MRIAIAIALDPEEGDDDIDPNNWGNHPAAIRHFCALAQKSPWLTLPILPRADAEQGHRLPSLRP
jgi:hypothetical protein